MFKLTKNVKLQFLVYCEMLKLIIIIIILGTIIGGGFGQLRIVGGRNAKINQYPYQISLQSSSGFHFCGGSLISNTWVMTAAHCAEVEDDYENIRTCKIRVGSSRYNKGGQILNIRSAILHPYYNSKTIANDIALLRLASPVTIQSAKPARLPRQDQEIPDGTSLKVTGWGVINTFTRDNSIILQAVEVPTINDRICNRIYIRNMKNRFCAGFLATGGKDSCQGDSGGPAAIDGIIFGIISSGYSCAEPYFPGVYTKVSKFRNWIKQITGV